MKGVPIVGEVKDSQGQCGKAVDILEVVVVEFEYFKVGHLLELEGDIGGDAPKSFFCEFEVDDVVCAFKHNLFLDDTDDVGVHC